MIVIPPRIFQWVFFQKRQLLTVAKVDDCVEGAGTFWEVPSSPYPIHLSICDCFLWAHQKKAGFSRKDNSSLTSFKFGHYSLRTTVLCHSQRPSLRPSNNNWRASDTLYRLQKMPLFSLFSDLTS